MVSKISGIYGYYDNLRCEIVYVGKDSDIEKNKRHREHYQQSRKDEQVINKILQNDNNSGRYTYVILEKGDFTNDMLNEKEISWISFFTPRFNFTEGGDGVGSGKNHPMYGKKHSKETREKMSEAQRGEKHSKETREKMSEAKKGENNPMYGKKHSKEAREKISEARKGKYSRENHPMYGKKRSKQTREKISEAMKGKNSPNYGKKGKNHSKFSSCIKIRKRKNNSCKEGFIWIARPSTPEKTIHISSVDLEKCIEKVEDFLKSEKNVYGYESYEVVDE